MPSYIVKAEPDQDFYVVWSDIVDAPTAWGTRAELENCRWLDPVEMAAERFARADAHGTSSHPRFYDWDDGGMVYLQQGYLPRSRLRELCKRLEEDEQASVADMLARSTMPSRR